MASVDRLAGQETVKRKRKRVSAKFRRLTKERRQANARERDRANALRSAFLSLEDTLPLDLKEQLPTRFGTMLAAMLYIGHLTELVCGGESPTLEVTNRAACRRYQQGRGDDEGEEGEALANESDDEQQIELKLTVGEISIQPLAASARREQLSPAASRSPLQSMSDSASSDSSSSSMSSGGGSNGRVSDLSEGHGCLKRCPASLLSSLDTSGHTGHPSTDLLSGAPLFSIPDLGNDDIFADIFGSEVPRLWSHGQELVA